MKIIFKPLQKADLTLLLKWLKTAHVKAFWDPETEWTKALVLEKYGTYVKGYKLENGIEKKISAFIIQVDDHSVGYIQAYNAYDFQRSMPLEDLPSSLAALDFLIGEPSYLKKGIGTLAIKSFLEIFLKKNYKYVFVDPNIQNTAAIKTYQKAGFIKRKENFNTKEIWMLKSLI